MAWKIKIIIITVLVNSLLSTLSAATPAPAKANDFTELFKNKSDMDWSGGDQMSSFKAPNGKIYWSVGDTLLSHGKNPDNSYPPDTVMVGNRLLLQNGDHLENAMADGSMAIPNPLTGTPENGERYWAQAMFYVNNYFYVLAQRVINDTDPNNFLGFKMIGVEMAKYTINSRGKLRFVEMVPTPSTGVVSGVGPLAIQWAADAIVQGNYVYVYGYTAAANNPYITHYSYVARVLIDQVEQPSSWQYFKKTTNQWVDNLSSLDTDPAKQLDAILSSQISSVRVINNQIVIAYKPWNGFGSAVYAGIGTNPQGPFTQKYLFDSPVGVWEGKHYMTYSPMLHPEQILTGDETGKILISICWNGIDFWVDTLGNADLYKPRFTAIDLFVHGEGLSENPL